VKHSRFFDDFLRDEVNLNPSRLERLNGHVDAVRKFLSQNLEGYEGIEPQGSYALRTIIKPVKDGQEYDADMLVYMSYASDTTARDYITRLYACLKSDATYATKAHKRTRCVELNYAGDVHLDIVPCIALAGGGQLICNNRTDQFEPTDGTGYRDWFNGKNAITQGSLKRVTRLLKYLRDHKGNFTVKSVLLTTLIGNTVDSEDDDDGFNTTPDALKAVSNHLDDFLQRNPLIPRVENPALPGEDFTRHWDQSKYANFRRLFHVYNAKVNAAVDAVDHDESIDKWRELFGDKFGKKRGDGDGSRSSQGPGQPGTPIVVTPPKPWAR
jgi:hypothetical protein